MKTEQKKKKKKKTRTRRVREKKIDNQIYVL